MLDYSDTPKPEFTLTLSEREAQALVYVLRHVGGSHETTMRGATDAVYKRLLSMGIGYDFPATHIINGNVAFEEGS